MSPGRSRTVRRPVRANTDLVRLTLDRLETQGATWAPRFVAIDGDDEIVTWLPGRPIVDWSAEPELLASLALSTRQLHDATTDLAAGRECLIHDDLQPRNVVVEDGMLGIIDWEQLRPGRRIEDVAQICWSFAVGPLDDGAETAEVVGSRWRRILDASGIVDRAETVPVALDKIDRCIGDIVIGAGSGSARHRRLEDRGDHHDLARLRDWIAANEASLLALIA